MSKRITAYLEKRKPDMSNLHVYGFILSIFIIVSISFNFLMVTIRSILIAPRVLEDLIPVIAGLLLAPIIAAILTLFFNDIFLGVTGAFLQILGRGLLLLPSDPENISYYAGMISGIFGQILLFLGIFSMIFKDIKFKDKSIKQDYLTASILSGIFLGFAINITLRMPGLALSENILMNGLFIILLVIACYTWVENIELKHKILKNFEQTRNLKRGNEKKFRKSLHLLILGPCIAILGFTLNRYEWLSAFLDFDYFLTGYFCLLSILISPIIFILTRNKMQRANIGLSCNILAFIFLGFMNFLPSGKYYIGILIMIPTGLFFTILEAIDYARDASINNIDISLISTWIVCLASIITLAMLSLLVFFPFTYMILFGILLGYNLLNYWNKKHRTKEIKEGGTL